MLVIYGQTTIFGISSICLPFPSDRKQRHTQPVCVCVCVRGQGRCIARVYFIYLVLIFYLAFKAIAWKREWTACSCCSGTKAIIFLFQPLDFSNIIRYTQNVSREQDGQCKRQNDYSLARRWCGIDPGQRARERELGRNARPFQETRCGV